MIGNAPRSYITGVPGWETPAEQALLVRLAKDVPENGVIVEIGAEYGMSASLFACGAHQSVDITSVDLYPHDLFKAHQHNMKLAGYHARTHQYKGDSSAVGRAWGEFEPDAISRAGSPIDLLFIDGDHTFRGCKADIDAWTPHVRIGGRVAFHDTACETNPNPHPLHHEVSQAISDWQAQTGEAWRLLETVDSIMVFERRV